MQLRRLDGKQARRAVLAHQAVVALVRCQERLRRLQIEIDDAPGRLAGFAFVGGVPHDLLRAARQARKLIERDQVSFLISDVNSGIAQAIAQVSNEKKVLHIVSGGHTDTITGSDCKWNVYRVCNTTSMEANAVANLLFTK